MPTNFALLLRFVRNFRLGNGSMCSTTAGIRYDKSMLHMPEDIRAKYQLAKCLKDNVFFNNDEYVATVKPFGIKNSVNVVKYVNRLPKEERGEIIENIDPRELYLTDVIPMLSEALNEQLLLVSRSIPPNVSGILLLSKSKKAFQRFDSFCRKAAEQNIPYMKFLCICVGTPRNPEGEDKFHVVKASDGEKSILDIGDGQYTQSQIKRQRCAVFPMKYRVVASNKDLSVLEIQTLALDWHNYRLYALDKGAPILGDHLYQRRIARILGKSVFVPFKSASERNQYIPLEFLKNARLSLREYHKLPMYCVLHEMMVQKGSSSATEGRRTDLLLKCPLPQYFSSLLYFLFPELRSVYE